jgi:hypothetical protein
MGSMTSTAVAATAGSRPGADDLPADPAEVLLAARAARRAADEAERRLLRLAVHWAGQHAVEEDSGDEACFWADGEPVRIAGDGAPLVAEDAVAELAASLSMSTDAGKHLVGDALELAHRLRRCWQALRSGSATAWQARRVARLTRELSPAALEHVDRHLAPVLGRATARQVERLVAEAVARHDPDEAHRRRELADDARNVTIDSEQVSYTGTVHLTADLDLADAYDLETAVAATADQLGRLGSTDTLDGRRATGLGEVARNQLALLFPEETGDGTAPPDPTVSVRAGRRFRRRLVVHVHLSDAALCGPRHGGERGDDALPVARLESMGNAVVEADVLREWFAGSQAVVKPVLDLADHVRVDSYEVPDRIREQVALRDGRACSRGAPGRRARWIPTGPARTATTSCPTPRAGPPAPATSRRSADATTGSRLARRGATSPSSPGRTCGARPTAGGTCATTPAPDRSTRPTYRHGSARPRTTDHLGGGGRTS